MWDLIVSVPDHCLSFYFFFYLKFVSYVLLYRYINAKLPVHLFLTMKSTEHVQIRILKLLGSD